MREIEEIKASVRAFLAAHVLHDQGSEVLADSDPLISSRLIDSIVALKLVNHLEEKFNIEFEAHEVDQENLDSVERIAAFVQTKLK